MVLTYDKVMLTKPNTISMLWLLPQYVILTAGEVLFSITSLAFAFTQAPESMKSLVQALYLVTTALGNLIDIFVIGFVAGVFSSQAYEFFLFAGLMLVTSIAMMIVAHFYEYVDVTAGDAFIIDSSEKSSVRSRRSSRSSNFSAYSR